MSRSVSSDDRISRVVCEKNKKNYCRVGSKEVKPKAFRPDSKGKTSTFVTTGLPDEKIWTMGKTFVCGADEVYGRADVYADTILDLKKIAVDYDNTPEYHANLTWPDDKEEILDMTQVLAAKADCITR